MRGGGGILALDEGRGGRGIRVVFFGRIVSVFMPTDVTQPPQNEKCELQRRAADYGGIVEIKEVERTSRRDCPRTLGRTIKTTPLSSDRLQNHRALSATFSS